MKILLNLLGIAIYFLLRYGNRTDKSAAFSGKYWLKDNWVELVVILLVDISLLLLLITNDISFNLVDFLPPIVAKIGDLGVSWLIGVALSHIMYQAIKQKVSK